MNDVQKGLVFFAAFLTHFKVFFQQGHQTGSVLPVDFVFNVFIKQRIHLFARHGGVVGILQPQDQSLDMILGEGRLMPEEGENTLKIHRDL
jgi:hypothetical protein